MNIAVECLGKTGNVRRNFVLCVISFRPLQLRQWMIAEESANSELECIFKEGLMTIEWPSINRQKKVTADFIHVSNMGIPNMKQEYQPDNKDFLPHTHIIWMPFSKGGMAEATNNGSHCCWRMKSWLIIRILASAINCYNNRLFMSFRLFVTGTLPQPIGD